MIILKSIGFGLLSLIVGNLLGFLLALIVGLAVEPIGARMLSDLRLKRARHIWAYACVGLTVGMINSSLILLFNMNGIVLTLIFLIYLVFFMKHKNEFILMDLCRGDLPQFKKLTRTTEAMTFVSYIMGFYGFWTILNWS